ncbi:hypothetical protein IMZ31_23055 (plasmid) [Pontibacillus sp. ALD_SL1]|uniref:hypothetical protein n=1 Tax=Pontibacillus sp. ALD_SL1 TaxID=2777185 RepID=UPI001A9786AE|nr:hypothetical protein [Pontibacillus sp. ALD_SL1]QST02333.1 hypothetical protein IMZ31_23055 [Pontibacillus sp. ALD_SL1]
MDMIKATDGFVQSIQQMESSFEVLKKEVKRRLSEELHEAVQEDDYKKANQLISYTEMIARLSVTTNAEELLISVSSFLGEEVSSEKEMPTKREKELIEKIGYNSSSCLKDGDYELGEIKELKRKNLIHYEVVEVGGKENALCSLTNKGKESFEEWFGFSPALSLKESFEKEYIPLNKGAFLYEAENAFQEKEYVIDDSSVNEIEVTKNGVHCYITLLSDEARKEEVFKILNRKHALMNIGFVCKDERSKKNVEQITEEWKKANPHKCKMVQIRHASIETLPISEVF